MNNEELSELNFGLILDDRVSVTMYKPDWFSAPYDKAVELLLQKGATKEDLAKTISSSYMTDAHNSVKRMNGLGESFDWVKSLQESYYHLQMGERFIRTGKKMKENEPVDLLPLYGDLGSSISNTSSGLVDAASVDYKNYKPFIKSGNPVQDKVIGGMPADGLIVKCGTTGTGKSHSLASDIDYFLKEYPTKTAALYTLEMSAEHYLWRETNMYPSLVDHIHAGRLKVSGSVRNIDELVAEVIAGRIDIVGLDDVDNIVKAQEAAEYERVNTRLTEICRFMKIPVIALCQPNREAKKAVDRKERFLSLYDAAWSGSAENKAALYISLQKMSADVYENPLEYITSEDEDLYYEIYQKSRDGWPADYDSINGQRGPGAIIRTKGKQAWRGEPYSGKLKLWQPGSGGRKIGKKSKKTED